MQFGRGLVLIGGVAVIGVAAFLFFGSDGSEPEEAPTEIADARSSEAGDLAAPAGEQTRESRMAAAREKRKAAAERRRAARERKRQEAGSTTGEVARTEAGSSRAAAERRAREGGTGAGGARDPRQEPPSDRAQIEALFREFAEAPREKADTPRDESSSETPNEGDPESAPKGVSAGSPIVMTCASTAWICNFYNLAFGLPGTIPVVSDGIEGIHIPMAQGRGEGWVRTTDGVTRIPTSGVDSANDFIWILRNFRGTQSGAGSSTRTQ